jgi:hypothetical protein
VGTHHRRPQRDRGYGLLNVTPSTAPIGELPLALVITADVPLMIALHIMSLAALARSARPVKAPLTNDPRRLESRWT